MDKDFLNILKSLLNNKPSKEISEIYKLNSFLDENFFNDISKNAPPNFSNIYYNFKNELETFYSLLVFPKLQNKNVVTLGGAFSSGKSSLINSLTDKNLLPYDINPTTSVPTYISSNDSSKVYAVNIFNNVFNLHMKNLKFISHEMESSDKSPLHFSQLIKSIYIEVPYFPFDNLIFIDTPGYSKSEVSNFHESDKDVSNFYYNSSDYLIWLVSSDIGTLTKEDIKILSKIKSDTKLLVILTKVDKLTQNNIDEIIVQLKITLGNHNINYDEIFAFSKRFPRDYDFEKIYHYLDCINKNTKNHNFLKNFYYYFNLIDDYYNKTINDESRKLFRLNNALTFIDNKTVEHNILVLADEIKNTIEELSQARETYRRHRDSFLFELKKIANDNNMNVTEENFYIFTDRLLSLINEYKESNLNTNDFEFEKIITNFVNSNFLNAITDKTEEKSQDIYSIINNKINDFNIKKDSLSFLNINYNDIVVNNFRKIFEGDV